MPVYNSGGNVTLSPVRISADPNTNLQSGAFGLVNRSRLGEEHAFRFASGLLSRLCSKEGAGLARSLFNHDF